MKRTLLVILLSLSTLAPAATPLTPLPQQARAAHLSADLLTRYHYLPLALDDAMSEKIFARYLKALDPDKFLFVQADIDRFASARTSLDDAIRREDLHVPFAIFDAFQRRSIERLSYARALLAQGFDFSGKESYTPVRDKAPWPRTEQENHELWRLRVKNDWLRLKLAGQEPAAIRATLGKRYDNALARANKYKSEDVLQIFMNAYAGAIEPHTDYLGMRASADFDISMKLSLVGIGAVLQEKDEYTTIRELVPGGPALLSGQLKPGDRIVGVGQGEQGALTDVVGWRIDDVVNLIRGAKDTLVRLDVLALDAGPDQRHRQVALVRNKISLEQQAARKAVLALAGGAKVGIITLPAFYQDFDARRAGRPDFKSASGDVARLLDELRAEAVDAVLLDLRDNGGGSLDEAVKLTGLFIGKGPVVQQRDASGALSIDASARPGAAWNGPLGVLINRGSASASEIFAAAIQDHGRGLVLGDTSFGKGTVQTMISLDDIAHTTPPALGDLKMTVAQFFRINGGTTQLRGVTPDIGLPSATDADLFGESSYDNALPWSQIRAAAYTPATGLGELLVRLRGRHDARIASDQQFQALLDDIAEASIRRKKDTISLNEDERRAEQAAFAARNKAHAGAAPADDGLQANERRLDAELAAQQARKEAKDVLRDEAAHILGDEVELLRVDGKLTARAAPPAGEKISPNR